jgi:hypothetical protein
MALTQYVVLWEHVTGNDGEGATSYFVVDTVAASTPKQAREMVAGSETVGAGITEQLEKDGAKLRAVPLRNWDGGYGTVKAETQRKIRSA